VGVIFGFDKYVSAIMAKSVSAIPAGTLGSQVAVNYSV
jgi:hypothetical protein